MQGLLADENIQGHLRYLRQLLEAQNLWCVLDELQVQLTTFAGLGLPRGVGDRHLWNYCQEHGWVLFTDNRNHDHEDSLNATLADSWQNGHLPVLTLANKGK